jgi:hypothetical protein
MKPATLFLNYLESLFKQEAIIFRGASSEDGLIEPAALVFENVPEIGFMTVVTYGLSFTNHEDWKLNRRPELVLTIDSLDKDYAIALADLVSSSRGKIPYLYGERINTGKIFKNSNVSGFVVFAPLFVPKEAYLDIDLGFDYNVCLNGIYPITNGENEIIDMIGFENFWKDGNFNLKTFHK